MSKAPGFDAEKEKREILGEIMRTEPSQDGVALSQVSALDTLAASVLNYVVFLCACVCVCLCVLLIVSFRSS